MVKKALIIILMLMSGAAFLSLRAQHSLFYHFNRENSGLSYDSIREIFSDSRGYVWIGTYKGLSRYDGTRFRNYDRNDFGVTSDFINVIREDVNGNIWIGTDNGVVIYEHETDEFVCLEKFLGGGSNTPNDRIFAIERNSNGVMWISSRDTGLYSYDPQTGSFASHPLSDEVPVNNIYRIMVDRNDNLYLAVYCDDIYIADPEAKSCYVPDYGAYSGIFKGDDVEGMVLSGKSNDILYVASKRNGIVEVDLRNRSCRILFSLPKDVRPTNMMLDSNKYLWLSTTHGLVFYDIYSGSHRTYQNDPRDQFSLSDSYITDVYKDNKGRLWVGTQYGGLDYCSPSHDNFTKIYTLNDGSTLEGAIVRSFAEDKFGNLWIATERKGLLKYSDGILKQVNIGEGRSVLAVAADADCLWVGSQKGISRIDFSTMSERRYRPFDTENRDNRVVTIYMSRSGEIYVATTIGVMKYDRDNDRFEMLPGLAGITVEHMAEDSRGVLWLASYSTGVYTYDLVCRNVIRNYSPQTGSCIPDMISSVCIDEADNVWIVGFSSGFFRYSRQNDDFQAFSTENTKSLPTDVYFMGIDDDYGNLWLSSDSGIVEFDSVHETVRVFTLADGLLDREFTKSGMQLRNGSMVFGSANGFVIFNSRNFQVGDHLAEVTITDMFLDYEPVRNQEGRKLFNGNLDRQRRLTLGFEDNSFGFAFAMLESVYPASDKIYCMLEGYDKEWRDISVAKAMHWTGVPAGTYKLCLSNGEFSGYFVDAHDPVTIVVKPKFWASTIGIILIVLMVISGLALLLFIILRDQKTRENRKMEEYRRRKDSEMLKDKMVFFSNIIHEIKTPLTLIRTPLQRIIASDSYDEAIKEELTVISSSTDYMNDLVRELLEFVRLEEHGYVLDLKNIDIAERVGFLCSNFYETAKSKNIKIQYSHKPDKVVSAVDKIAFRKIVNNLLDNGVKYADTYIKVELQSSDTQIVISFRNDGALIPPSRRELIFKPFVQYSADTSPYSQSFGIGLAHARNLAELHGGTLELSDSEEYTEFVLRLPLRTVQEVAVDEESELEIAKRSDLPLVLIVEDNASLLTYLKKSLKHEYNVVPAQSAEKALTLLKSYKVDIILTDIALQGMSGVELCEKINTNPELSHIPVIVVSAISSVETKMKCMEYGAMNYIEKPYSMDYLTACIRGALEKRATLRAAYGTSTYGLENIQANLLNRDEDFLKKLEKVVMENMSNPAFSNKQLEEFLYMGHSTLNRKMKSLLDTTPNDYIRTKRLALAAEMLAEGGRRVNEVCYAVGFNSPSYFAKCFRNAYGKLPAEWAKERTAKSGE